MKKLLLFSLIFITIISCKNDAAPDLAEKFAGEYYATKSDSIVTTNQTWTITRQDLNHVNVLFYFMNIYRDGSVTRSKYDIYIPGVLVSEANTLNFNNEFIFDQLKCKVIGKASLTNDFIDYDITITDEYSSRKLTSRIYRQ